MHAVLDQLMAENRRFADRPGDDDVGAGYDLLESGRRLDHDLGMAGLFGRHEGIERRLGPTPDTHPTQSCTAAQVRNAPVHTSPAPTKARTVESLRAIHWAETAPEAPVRMRV